MEEARQHTTLVSDRFGILLFSLIVGEIVSAVAILVLAFAAPRHVFLALHSFGVFVALRMAALVAYGLVKGILPSRRQHIQRIDEPLKFWLYLVLYVFGIAVGLFLTQVPIE